MAEFEHKFLVLNRKFLARLSDWEADTLIRLLRKADPDPQAHQYVVCNRDEPYAHMVERLILDGETAKENIDKFGEKSDDLQRYNVHYHRNVVFSLMDLGARSFKEAAAMAHQYVATVNLDHLLSPSGTIGEIHDVGDGQCLVIDRLNESGDTVDSITMLDPMAHEELKNVDRRQIE